MSTYADLLKVISKLASGTEVVITKKWCNGHGLIVDNVLVRKWGGQIKKDYANIGLMEKIITIRLRREKLATCGKWNLNQFYMFLCGHGEKNMANPLTIIRIAQQNPMKLEAMSMGGNNDKFQFIRQV